MSVYECIWACISVYGYMGVYERAYVLITRIPVASM